MKVYSSTHQQLLPLHHLKASAIYNFGGTISYEMLDPCGALCRILQEFLGFL